MLENEITMRPLVGTPKLVAGRNWVKISAFFISGLNSFGPGCIQYAVILHPAVGVDDGFDDDGIAIGVAASQTKGARVISGGV